MPRKENARSVPAAIKITPLDIEIIEELLTKRHEPIHTGWVLAVCLAHGQALHELGPHSGARFDARADEILKKRFALPAPARKEARNA